MKKHLANICVALLLLLFAYTATSKFLEHPKFVFQMRLAPVPFIGSIAPVISWLIPGLETLIVAGLLIDRFRVLALYTAAILLILFEIYISIMLLSGLHLPCTCGGIISGMSWKQHLLFNALFLLITITAIAQHKKQPSSLPLKPKGMI
jgi:putative oxidoreductase